MLIIPLGWCKDRPRIRSEPPIHHTNSPAHFPCYWLLTWRWTINAKTSVAPQRIWLMHLASALWRFELNSSGREWDKQNIESFICSHTSFITAYFESINVEECCFIDFSQGCPWMHASLFFCLSFSFIHLSFPPLHTHFLKSHYPKSQDTCTDQIRTFVEVNVVGMYSVMMLAYESLVLIEGKSHGTISQEASVWFPLWLKSIRLSVSVIVAALGGDTLIEGRAGGVSSYAINHSPILCLSVMGCRFMKSS